MLFGFIYLSDTGQFYVCSEEEEAGKSLSEQVCTLENWKIINPWSLGSKFMVQKMSIISPMPSFKG